MSDIKQALAEAMYSVWPYHWEGSGASSATTGAHGHTAIQNQTWKVYDQALPNGMAEAMAATEPMQAIACDAAVGRAMQRADFSLYPGEWDADWAWYCRFGTQPAHGGRTAFAAIAAALGDDDD
jgi:hypothetical protein